MSTVKKENDDKSLASSNNPGIDALLNSLTAVLRGGRGITLPGGYDQLSEVDTLFKSQRWYQVTNLRQLLAEMYAELGIVQTIVDIPVEDAMGDNIEIKTKLLDDDELAHLLYTLESKNDFQTVAQAAKWNRLFGGAGILILTDHEPEMPFKTWQIGEDDRLEFRAVDLWELYFGLSTTDDRARTLAPEDFFDTEYFDYYGLSVHNSRVMKLSGIVAPSFIKPRLRGWGLSVIEALVRPIQQYLKATTLSFECLDEFKIDIYKFQDLAAQVLSQSGMQQMRERLEAVNMGKSFHNAIVLDKEDEYEQKRMAFQGLGTVMQEIRHQLASDLRMPQTKLFGQSPGGMNSSGSSEIENYNRMIESTIRKKIKWPLLSVVKLRCKQLFGVIPEDLDIEFESLRILTEEQEENVKTFKYARLLEARQAGEISSKDFKEGINKADLLPLKIDPTDEMFLPEPQDNEEMGTNENSLFKRKLKELKESMNE